ncbi:carbohydrate sulfotransferase 11-like [Hydractinia symbiolongicarpus]|uniref:carbohydrate sulfotransferase 11-like n=1 Tax=Hydractinia symbiolongicarpus TaxID=13093 RepID=UPI00254BB6F6|nr:carbohydrate sulfotransferase 11-like [Hydractinia symbiolongicarpus]
MKKLNVEILLILLCFVLVVFFIEIIWTKHNGGKGHYYTKTSSNILFNQFVNLKNEPDINKKPRIIEETQEERKQRLRNFCRSNKSRSTWESSHPEERQILISDKQGLLYCTVPKVACTNWKRMFQVFEGQMKNLFSIESKDKIHTLKYKTFVGMTEHEKLWKRGSHYSFMFVRHPFERLYSAYRNKLNKPFSDYHQKVYGSRILKMFRSNLSEIQYKKGENVTFVEFLKFITKSYQSGGYKSLDEHWQIMTKICVPCSMKYDYIGKMETLIKDANNVLTETGLNGKFEFPSKALDNYTEKASSSALKNFLEIPLEVRRELYEVYKDDFEAFGYTPDKYFQTVNRTKSVH